MEIKVKIKRLDSSASLPVYSSADAAGCDLFACIDEPIEIGVNQIARIPTGIAIEPMRKDVAALIYGRSGLGTKYGITLANSVGVVDSDYRGEISVCLINHGSSPYTVNPGDRIAQMIFTPILFADFTEADELSESERGIRGFGSTGK